MNKWHNTEGGGVPQSGVQADWQEIVARIIVDKEYETSKANMDKENNSFDAVLDMLACERAEKDYEWQSDIFIPDFPSIHWQQIGDAVVQYFSRWEKVDCPPTTNAPEDVLKAKAARDFINYHLNQSYLHYLPKFIRFQSLNRLGGWCVLKLWYESDVQIVQTGEQKIYRPTGYDIYGDSIDQSPYPERVAEEMQPVFEKQINLDRPNFEVWPNNCVFMDNKYCYSLQDKDYVIFQSEEKLSKLQTDAEKCQYFNLDLLTQDTETDTENAGFNKKTSVGEKYERIIQKYDPDVEILERWGKWPVIMSPEGQITNGIDDDGNLLEGARSIEAIITVGNIKKKKVLIRFQPNLPEFNAYGFRPMIRVLCYIHPTKDHGLGDGIYARELQKAINDTFNMNNDRTRIATFPTLKKRKYADVDNDTLIFGPEHIMELENLDDVAEFQIQDNIQGGLLQQQILFQKLQQVLATNVIDLGGMTDRREAVTTVMLANQKNNTRNSLISLTVEHTGLQEFYSMLLKMSGMFMQPETLMSILGELTFFFDPISEYNFIPVSTSVITEQAKESKIDKLTNMLGLVAPIPNPNTFALINIIVSEIFELMGKEYAQYSKFLLDPTAPHPDIMAAIAQAQATEQRAAQTGGNGGGGQQTNPKRRGPKAQNQYGNPQTTLEQVGRRMGTVAGGGQQ